HHLRRLLLHSSPTTVRRAPALTRFECPVPRVERNAVSGALLFSQNSGDNYCEPTARTGQRRGEGIYPTATFLWRSSLVVGQSGSRRDAAGLAVRTITPAVVRR